MSDVIRLLPDSVANQIAAGEVIQRPASVIKELVENSIDAGATSVTIVLKDAGRTLIQVIDNGCGMSDTDARMAFERHATSKIQRADDLFTLSTMGFRGEALASIAAIAQVDMRTMKHGETVGTRILINGSRVESQEPEACVPGSNIMVKNLFFNVPARRKFLKKNAVELAAIMREFERLALVNINVDFTMVSDDVTLHSLRRASLKQRIVDLFGKNLDKHLVPIETDTSLVGINGFIGLPAYATKTKTLQFLMVNGRNMNHPYFRKAILQCYERLIPDDKQPNFFINFHVDPETIDVNIHPTKSEIKFENEQGIWQILTAAVRDSLGRYNVAPSIDFDVEDSPDIPTFNPDDTASHGMLIDVGYNPFNQDVDYDPRSVSPIEMPQFPEPDPEFGRSTALPHIERRTSRLNADVPPSRPSAGGGSHGTRVSKIAPDTDWGKLYDEYIKKRDEGLEEMARGGMQESLIDAPSVPVGDAIQLKNSYIVMPCREGMMVIDQHRAHKTVLYHEYLKRAVDRQFTSQSTMFPETLELTAAQDAILKDLVGSLEELGFRLAQLGDLKWGVNAVPSIMKDASVGEMLVGIVENVTETGQDVAASMHEAVALQMARSGAIKRGQALSADEMEHLVGELFKLSAPGISPEGKRVFAVIQMGDITRMFD